MKNAKENNYVVTFPIGLEACIEVEIAASGLEFISASKGVAHCAGSLEVIYRYCLYSRLANRVLYPISSFNFYSLDELVTGSREIEWENWFSADQTFSIESSVINLKVEGINDHRIMALKVKDGLVDRFMDMEKRRPSVDGKTPDFPIRLLIEKNEASLSLDMVGSSLHQRGYRVRQSEAPIKENLAAGLYALSTLSTSEACVDEEGVEMAGIEKPLPTQDTIVDPMCGSGTLLIEAAFAIKNIPPGVERENYGFMGWRGHRVQLWEQVLAEAKAHKEKALADKDWPKIIGYDADNKAMQAAKANITQAGLENVIHVERKELFQCVEQFRKQAASNPEEKGLLLVNPPYGERIDELSSAAYLYTFLGKLVRNHLKNYSVVCIAGQIEHLDHMALETVYQAQLFNGPIRCTARHMRVSAKPFIIKKPSLVNNDVEKHSELDTGLEKTDSHSLSRPLTHDDERRKLSDKTVEGAEAFCNRLRKNWKSLRTWVQQEDVSCFRLYDADIPEFNVAVDVFPHACHVQEYAPPKDVDIAKAQQRLALIVESIVKVLDIPKRDVFLKVRSKQKGKNQYTKNAPNNKWGSAQSKPGTPAKPPKLTPVPEGQASLLVNLSDYLDTGLFLDHRPLRLQFAQKSKGLRFLNLFSYTGAATVQAAIGGAKSSCSVDLSTTYCQWAQANLALNGFSSARHEVIKSDVKAWLEETPRQFDLIFMDPPTFSNSKSTRQHFDVQADHVAYIDLAMRRLEPGGTLYFSTNFRRFKCDEEQLYRYELANISEQTIPRDFARNPKIHQVWTIQHTEKSLGYHAKERNEAARTGRSEQASPYGRGRTNRGGANANREGSNANRGGYSGPREQSSDRESSKKPPFNVWKKD